MSKAVVLEAMFTVKWSSLDTSRIKPLPIKFLKEYRNLNVSLCEFCVSIRLFIAFYYLNSQQTDNLSFEANDRLQDCPHGTDDFGDIFRRDDEVCQTFVIGQSPVERQLWSLTGSSSLLWR